MNRYRLAGLNVASSVPLPLPSVGADAALRSADVQFNVADPETIPDAIPKGRVLQFARLSSETCAFTVEVDGTIRAILPGVFCATYDREGRHVTLKMDSRHPTGMFEVMAAAAVWGALLRIRGHSILHASAVRFDSLNVGFFGPSGSGKSTLAALAFSAGARVLSDDLLPLAADNGGWSFRPAATTLRMRPGVLSRQQLQGMSSAQVSSDGRELLATGVPEDWRYTLDGLATAVFDSPEALWVERLAPVDALVSLVDLGKRSIGLKDRDWLRRDFEAAAWLARHVPVLRLHVPRRALSGAELLAALREAIA